MISSPRCRHADRVQEVPEQIDSQVSERLDVQVICDNYGIHESPAIRRWVKQHPRFHIRHTLTHFSSINQVERWFAYLAADLLRRLDTGRRRRSKSTSAGGSPGGTRTPSRSSRQDRQADLAVTLAPSSTNQRRGTLDGDQADAETAFRVWIDQFFAVAGRGQMIPEQRDFAGVVGSWRMAISEGNDVHETQ